VSGGPKFFTTAAGSFGLAPFNVTENSLIVLLHGSKLPVVLEEKAGGLYEFVGFAYAHGIMCDELKRLGRSP
jgi:hypothetical protein